MPRNHSASKPSVAQIRAQRDRILAAKLFALSNRMRSLLGYIVDAALEDRADKLKEFTLGIDVFERDESFDPSIDSIVRVEASRLRSKLREYYDSEGKLDPVRIEIPKGHYVPVFHLINQDSDLGESNAGEDFRRSKSIIDTAPRKLSLAGVALMFVAALYLVLDVYVLDQGAFSPAEMTNVRSVAVLPFLPLSSGEDDGYFADGLTEEILNSLAQLPELQVTARTSSFYFKGQDLLVPDIATRLRVAHVVEGSVRRDGERLRIVAQLIRATDGYHLWSQSYDRTRDDVFAVQEDIAENIAEILGVVLDDGAREIMRSAGIGTVEAFIAYQKGQEAWIAAHERATAADTLELANAHFDAALADAPALTMARLMKADLRGHIIFDVVAGSRDENYPAELQETLTALREEYSLAVRLSPVGNQRDIVDLERALFDETWRGLTFRIREATQPGNCPQMNWSSLVAHFGWADQFVEKWREAIKCNPLDTFARFQLAWSLIWAGDADAALQSIDEAENMGLSHPSLNDGRYWAELASGRIDDFQAAGSETMPSRLAYDRRILREALTGDLAIARQMANDYWSGSDADDLSSIVIAAAIGDRDKANEAAARVDAFSGSAVVISHAVFSCFCGAPFDLDAAPNYKAQIDEAGLPWPPPKRIDYPAKTW